MSIGLCFLRHGPTVWTLEKRYCGQSDPPLAEGQAAILEAQSAMAPQVDVLFSSPARRCQQTLMALYPGRTFSLMDDFWERDFGPFEGKGYEELKEDCRYRAFIQSAGKVAPPGVEAYDAFLARIKRGLKTVYQKASAMGASAVLLASHGGVAMAMAELAGHKNPYALLPSVGASISFVMEDSGCSLSLAL